MTAMLGVASGRSLRLKIGWLFEFVRRAFVEEGINGRKRTANTAANSSTLV